MILNNENVSIRTLTILKHLGVSTLEELRNLELPKVGAIIKYYGLAGATITYTKKVNDEILTLLND